MTNHITVTIEKLAGLGDGQATHEGRKLFVPYTLPGDVVEASISKRTKDADYARLEKIITPSPQRAQPICRHFGQCGGCALQHMQAEAYRAFKSQTAREAVRKAGFDPEVVLPLRSFPTASRRRVELRVRHGKLGYFAAASHQLVAVEECKVLAPDLEQLVLNIARHCRSKGGDGTIHINGLDKGYDVLLEGQGAEQWLPEDEIISRVSIKKSNKIQLLKQRREALLTLAGVCIVVPPGAFLQAVQAAQEAMIALVEEACASARHVLDLFAGIGTYSFPLSQHRKVHAVEGDAVQVKALQAAAKKNGIAMLSASQRDLFCQPLRVGELSAYDAVVINPPRSGAAGQCAEFAASSVPVVVMVSCNPATFARDARVLREGGYRLARLTPIDQFIFSPHLELVGVFGRG